MISYDGSDLTTASLSKKCSPQQQEVAQSSGKVVKSIFVPNVGWASQVLDQQFNRNLLFNKTIFFLTC